MELFSEPHGGIYERLELYKKQPYTTVSKIIEELKIIKTKHDNSYKKEWVGTKMIPATTIDEYMANKYRVLHSLTGQVMHSSSGNHIGSMWLSRNYTYIIASEAEQKEIILKWRRFLVTNTDSLNFKPKDFMQNISYF
jgi:hypothetical protein